jgi:isoamylase
MLMRYPQVETDLRLAPSFGAAVTERGVEFLVYSHSATAMRLLLYDQVSDLEPAEVIDLDPEGDRWGDVWRGFVRGIGHGQLYHLQADGPFDPNRGYWFDGSRRLIDPYTHALAGDFQKPHDGMIRPPKCVVIGDDFDWEGDRCLNYDLADSIIYEVHVRGFTQHRSSGAKHPGTYLGMLDKISHLKSLGITAIELMPVHEYPILRPNGTPLSRPNYWGYDPDGVFRAASRLRAQQRAWCSGRGVQDIGQGDASCRDRSDPGRGLQSYLRGERAWSGAQFQRLGEPHVLSAGPRRAVLPELFGLREHGELQPSGGPAVDFGLPAALGPDYHVDGFRFDLASILSRGRDGNLNYSSPLVEEIAEDPVLAKTKIIAEAGMRRALIRWVRSGESAGRNGTGVTGTTCVGFGEVTGTCWARSPRVWPVRAICTNTAAGHPSRVSTWSRRTTGSRCTTGHVPPQTQPCQWRGQSGRGQPQLQRELRLGR